MIEIPLFLALVLSPVAQERRNPDSPTARNAALMRELVGMERADQAALVAMMKAFADNGIAMTGGKPVTDPKMLAVIAAESRKVAELGAAHRTRLAAVVTAHGWPGKSLVGEEGAHAAWLLVQHADDDPPFQEKCLRLMQAAPAGEVAGRDLAYLTDRVLVRRGEPQKYGTQLGPDFEPLPVADAKTVDARRAALGLQPLAEYAKAAKAEYEKRLTPRTPKK